jgi:hypothetical protein
MKRIIFALALAGGFSLLASISHAGCNDPDVDSVRATINSECPCTGNHGQYVSCVTHHVREAVSSGQLDVNCKGAVTRCAARSTCGKKSGFVTCAICDPGTCTSGLCDDGTTACADSSTCPLVLNRCSTKSTTEHCADRGGFAGTGSCCDATCPPPG